jgi:hypothetical protein
MEEGVQEFRSSGLIGVEKIAARVRAAFLGMFPILQLLNSCNS